MGSTVPLGLAVILGLSSPIVAIVALVVAERSGSAGGYSTSGR